MGSGVNERMGGREGSGRGGEWDVRGDKVVLVHYAIHV